MARRLTTSALGIAGALTLVTPGLAQECLEDMAAADSRNVGIQQHLSEQELRGYTTLRQGARFLVQNDREDACEELAETYNDMLSDRRATLVDEGVMVDVAEQQRVDQLMAAPRVTELQQPLSAGRIIGSDVRNYRNADLGDVTDVVISPESGNITHVLIESGGFLGLGEDVVAVPLDALQVADNGNTFVLDMTRERFEEAPTIEGGVPDAAALSENDGYFTSSQ